MINTNQPSEPMRLNKFLAHAGYGSRREVERLIVEGRISIEGEPVTELATRVQPGQKIRVDGQLVKEEKSAYWLVNKPKGVLCTNHDPDGRQRVIDLVPRISQRVYTVGRLDEASEGLILLTNDGDLAHHLTHPRFGVEKTYLVQVAGFPTFADIRQLTDGIWISEGKVRAKKVKRLKTQGRSTWLRIVLNEGKNREIRRMLAKLEHKVITLKRIALGPIPLGSLLPGKSRRLRGEEVQQLRALALGEETPATDEKRDRDRSRRKRSGNRAPTGKRSAAPRKRREKPSTGETPMPRGRTKKRGETMSTGETPMPRGRTKKRPTARRKQRQQRKVQRS